MISSSVIAGLAFYAILPALFGVAIALVCRGRMTLSVRNVVLGAGVFFLFSQVLEKLMHAYVLDGNPVTASWLQVHPIGYALYACLAAGLFEETGRYLAMRFLVKDTGNPGTAVAYGLGHGGIEAILLGSMGLVVTLVYAVKLYMGQDAQLSAILGPEGLARLRADLQSVPHVMLVMQVLERLIALLIQIGLSFVVWRAVQRRQLAWLALAVLLHAAIDFPVGLAQAGQLSQEVIMGWLLVIGSAFAACFLYGLLRKSAPAVPQPA
jgi:uncharacterized membrane protein YhfC